MSARVRAIIRDYFTLGLRRQAISASPAIKALERAVKELDDIQALNVDVENDLTDHIKKLEKERQLAKAESERANRVANKIRDLIE